MSILIDKETSVIVQGITGREGSFHARQMQEYGTKVVCGVTPGKGGTTHVGVPVFDTVYEAVRETGATASVIFVPPQHASDAILESADSGVGLVVCITEGIPVHDMVVVRRALDGGRTRLIGPNCPGLITPGQCKIGIMPGYIHKPGGIGVLSRSGTLTYEAVHQLTAAGLGQSTCVGIGGDPIVGSSFTSLMELFAQDAQTEAVLIIGEIGGTQEEEVAGMVRSGRFAKPVFAYVAGQTAPEGRRMGHAGAIVSGGQGTAAAKIAALEEAGITAIDDPSIIGETVRTFLLEKRRVPKENQL